MLLPEPLWPTIARNSPWRTLEAHAAQHRHFDRALAVALVQIDRPQLAGLLGLLGDVEEMRPFGGRRHVGCRQSRRAGGC